VTNITTAYLETPLLTQASSVEEAIQKLQVGKNSFQYSLINNGVGSKYL